MTWPAMTYLAAPLTLAAMPVVALSPASAPQIQGTTLAGEQFSLADNRGQVVVLNFWATWCVPCRAELPAFDRYYRTNRSQGLRMLAISVDVPAKAREVRQASGAFAFDVASISQFKVPGAFRTTTLPRTLIFDRDGHLRWDSVKAKAGVLDEQTLGRIVGPLLAEQTGRQEAQRR